MKKRLFVLPFALLILIMAVAFPASADTPSSIRVYLRRLQVEDTLRVTVKGQYATQDGRLSFSDGRKAGRRPPRGSTGTAYRANGRRYGQQHQAGALSERNARLSSFERWHRDV